MKITKVEIFDCEVNRKDASMAKFNPVLLRVHTDAGISGIGEVGLAYGAGAKAAVGILRDFASFIIGRDPMKVEAIWELLFRTTYWGAGGGPVIYGGMSAIDIALWDIRGQVMGQPIYQLLGGKTNDDLRTYASQLQFGWGDVYSQNVTPDQYAASARAAIEEGYDAVKVDPLQIGRDGVKTGVTRINQKHYGLLSHAELEMGVERIAAIREAVGPGVDIICEIHSLLGTNSAIQFANAIEPYNIFYYEEPVNPLNAKNFEKIASKTSIPLATGERSYTRWGYRELLEKQALAVVQPDLCLAGGITEGKKICDMANVYDATVQIHICGGPVSTAAALHVEAVVPNFVIHEHHTYALKSCVRELCVHDYQPERGRFTVPDAPGLGQALNDEVVKDYLAYSIE
ncbi:mandelate racemase/muconate lactonizing enzyme family protein [Cupriavidus sp. WGlv3]|uniref:mandelate racemase/muconate lactonizing enzyme family protein n=1 Tax=Cupriavidus sp. WGlv3 TaxID=2919924 RepID=UPI002090C2C7|nr:mandelate racemase/muconate lactonizing enzyme family protein [Cupriavidus sp. WGlv3]MCO4863797.1 mandelate racemase/muconate lactonizing enzyme family protein [Cupriavidus sp. WGlv3]